MAVAGRDAGRVLTSPGSRSIRRTGASPRSRPALDLAATLSIAKGAGRRRARARARTRTGSTEGVPHHHARHSRQGAHMSGSRRVQRDSRLFSTPVACFIVIFRSCRGVRSILRRELWARLTCKPFFNFCRGSSVPVPASMRQPGGKAQTRSSRWRWWGWRGGRVRQVPRRVASSASRGVVFPI